MGASGAVLPAVAAQQGVGSLMSNACPNCKDKHLEKTQLEGFPDDILVCQSCDGIWLAYGTLKKVVAEREINLSIPRGARMDNRFCPCCGKELYTFRYPLTFVMVDMCKGCQGVWLDRNELQEIDAVRYFITQSKLPTPNETQPSDMSPLKAWLLQFIDERLENTTLFSDSF